jgi:hypothetical protein
MKLHVRVLAVGTFVLVACAGSSADNKSTGDAGTGADGSTKDASTADGNVADAGQTGEGGADTTSIKASDFNQSCTSSADCVLVMDGSWKVDDPCCGKGCGSAAINKSDQMAYSDALKAAVAKCTAFGGCGVDCAYAEAYCDTAMGKCAVCTGSFGCGDGGMSDAGTD